MFEVNEESVVSQVSWIVQINGEKEVSQVSWVGG